MLEQAAPLRPIHALTMGEVGSRMTWRRRVEEEGRIPLEKHGWIRFTGMPLPLPLPPHSLLTVELTTGIYPKP